MITRITASLKRRFVALWFRRRLGRAGQAPACLVAYLPQRQQGWILDFLWRDLCEQLRRQPGPAVGVVATAAELWTRSRGTDLMVLAMSLDALNALIALGFPPERIVFYHTHVRLGLPMQKLDLLHAVLVLNGFEAELVGMRKVPRSRIHRFPAGYDPTLFAPPASSRPRSIDVLFVGRYRKGTDGYYHKRKRYGFQVALAERLLAQGHTVAFLGSDWDGCEYPLDSRIQILEEPHARYATVYQDARLVCSVAAQEGGPVSFLEGLACGCLMVSAPTGFIGDLHLSEVACWTLPLPAPPQEWADTIDHLLRTVEGPSEQQQAQRRRYLQAAQFPSLATQLVEICWPSR